MILSENCRPSRPTVTHSAILEVGREGVEPVTLALVSGTVVSLSKSVPRTRLDYSDDRASNVIAYTINRRARFAPPAHDCLPRPACSTDTTGLGYCFAFSGRGSLVAASGGIPEE